MTAEITQLILAIATLLTSLAGLLRACQAHNEIKKVRAEQIKVAADLAERS